MIHIDSRIQLNNGVEIPMIGLGVYGNPAGQTTRLAIKYALSAGYRHIDTAMAYRNETDVGVAIASSGLKRNEIFVTTKLGNAEQGYDSTLQACDKSLKRLNLDFVDLYLMHWPVKEHRLQSWKAMEKLLAEGKCRSIGVSNFMVPHLKELLENSDLIPAINQIELSPYNYQQRLDVLDICNKQGIVIEAYSPITKGQKLGDPRLVKIAGNYGKTAAQILIRWALEKNFVVIPKSANQNRIIENSGVFDFSISSKDMKILDSFNENLATAWDPTDAP